MKLSSAAEVSVAITPATPTTPELWDGSVCTATIEGQGTITLAYDADRRQYVVDAPWMPPSDHTSWVGAFGAFLTAYTGHLKATLDRSVADLIPPARAIADTEAARLREARRAEDEARDRQRQEEEQAAAEAFARKQREAEAHQRSLEEAAERERAARADRERLATEAAELEERLRQAEAERVAALQAKLAEEGARP